MAKQRRIADDPAKLQSLVDDPVKLEKWREAARMYKEEGLGQKQVSKRVRMSLRDIPDAIQLDAAGLIFDMDALKAAASKGRPEPMTEEELELQELRNLSTGEKDAEAHRMFREGKGPVEVAIALLLDIDHAMKLHQGFLAAMGLWEVGRAAQKYGNAGIRKLAHISTTLQLRGLNPMKAADDYVACAERMHNKGMTEERLDGEIGRKRKELDRLDKQIGEKRLVAAGLAEKKAWVEKLRAEETRIQQECPEASVAVIAEQMAKGVLEFDHYINGGKSVNLKAFGLAVDAAVWAIRNYPYLVKIIFPEQNLSVQYNTNCRTHIIQLALPYYVQILTKQIADESAQEVSTEQQQQ